ncbi:type IV secretion system protein [Pelosinus propionicus]|uniref:P-type conjugative transfer protein TrbJ n=1 Tax=Pelosinus propionicus DSM 13327 TaxID=1123291 RepID=A0A1I4QE11_9FIRM|nr:hypothetical protein [Pelosinus propionicus]SFM38298.1 P-type conjugative transfer protein TrbJ [Pelosinus propionicus DSM 13327]
MKKKSAIIFSAILAATIAVPRVFAAVPVFDATNTAENHATFLQAAQQVINSATQIANQALELKPVSSDSLDAHATTVNREMTFVQTILNQFQGLMNPGKPSSQVWSETFKPIDNYFTLSGLLTPSAIMTNNQNMSYSADQTFQDGLKTAKAYADITQDAALLQELMEQNKNAVGNKQLGQIQNNLLAQQNSIYIKQNQIVGAMTSAVIASNARQNQIDAQATAISKKEHDDIQAIISKKRTSLLDGEGEFK